jgi:hypothetical protein
MALTCGYRRAGQWIQQSFGNPFQPDGPRSLDQHHIPGSKLAAKELQRRGHVRHQHRTRPGSCLVHRSGLLPHHDEPVHIELNREGADLPVRLRLGLAELGQRAEHGPAAPLPAGHRDQGPQRGGDRLGVCVVGVVDHGHPVGAIDDLQPPA